MQEDDALGIASGAIIDLDSALLPLYCIVVAVANNLVMRGRRGVPVAYEGGPEEVAGYSSESFDILESKLLFVDVVGCITGRLTDALLGVVELLAADEVSCQLLDH